MSASRKKRSLPEPAVGVIESLSHEGRGVVHVNGKTVFVDNALPGETVRFRYRRRRSKRDEAEAVEILNTSPRRVTPFCAHFQACGGCSLQHMDPAYQIEHKQHILLEQLHHIGGVEPREVLAPLTGPLQGYRHKARLGARYVFRKERVLVGFREKHSSFIADLDHCGVLHPSVAGLFPALKALLGELSIYDCIPQIEVAVGEGATVLVLRHLAPLAPADKEKLRAFEKQHRIRFWLQPGGPGSAAPLQPDADDLYYRFADEGITLYFHPLDFTQVNFAMNRAMLKQILELLQPAADDTVLDLFCGLGNFSLPLARHVAGVTGVEGDAALLQRARANAERNSISNVRFLQADLYSEDLPAGFPGTLCDKILLDPPRAGALAILQQLDLSAVKKLVYVSCNPATLARDAGMLAREKGMMLIAAGIMDMFPHTSHVESIALFERQ
jgi:23S rRNA (uracil1939-C5)-methyltransferase